MLEPSFLEWCEQNGISAHGIMAARVEEGSRGFIATRDLQAGETVLKVPSRMLMSTQSAKRDPQLGDLLATERSPSSASEVLTVHLVHEMSKGESSFWHPYLSQLPKAHHDFLHFSKDDVESLQFSWGMENARMTVQQAKLAWKRCRWLLQCLSIHKKWQSKKAWFWAASTLSSRAMFVPWDSAGALTPLGDLFNYQTPSPPVTPLEAHNAFVTDSRLLTEELPGSGVYCADADEYHLFVQKSYQKGEQVFLCYGWFTNLQLLEHYGFVLEENPLDSVPLLRDTFGSKLAASLYSVDRYIHANGSPSWALLQALRLHFGGSGQQNIEKALAGEAISLKEECSVMQTIVDACQITLASVSTTIDEDNVLLQHTSTENTRRQLALQWRMCQKRTLLKALKLAADVQL